jgi:predicted ATPase
VRVRFAGYELDDRRVTLTGPNGQVHVEPQVFALLRLLALHRDRVVAKEELLDSIWGDRFVSESALTSRVKAARRAVGDDGQAQRVIRTVHGHGYEFVADVTVEPDGDGHEVRPPLPRLRNRPIGRDDDIAEVAARARAVPLVTITGPGGMGKTTVGLAVAERLRDELADGAVFVDLAPVPAGSDITRAVADAAGIEGAASESCDRVADHLADRPVLLVLDNCEHVLAGAAALVDRMLHRGTTGPVVATSREPLDVAGEHVWPLGPLHDAGAALFVERARAAEPRVAWDPDDEAVVQLCRRLDDVPLALELAAGQLRRFDLDELLRRLDQRLSMLAAPGAGEERHATMEAAIDWSYRLLDPVEQRLLRQLGVFPSSFDTASVEAAAPDPLDAIRVFGALVDKSLVVRQPGAGYRLLETIRVFALDRLEEAGETGAAFERHRRAVVDRVAAATRLDRWMSGRLGAGFRAGLDDARQAFRASLDQGETSDAVELAVGASFLWRNAIGCTEAGAWLGALLAEPLAARDEVWVHLLRADVGQGRGDHRLMVAATAGAMAIADGAGDPAAVCLAAHFAALEELTAPTATPTLLAEALELARRSGDDRLVTLVEAFGTAAGIAAGDHERARTTLERLDTSASGDGYDRFIVNWAGWMLGLAERDAVAARRWMRQQQVFLDRTGILETWITSFSTTMCEVVEGADVRPGLAHTLQLADREGYRADGDCVLVLAYAALCAERYEEAAELIGSAMGARFNATAHYALYRTVLEPLLRTHGGGVDVAAAVARGRARAAADALAAHGVSR